MDYPVYVLEANDEIPLPGTATTLLVPLEKVQFIKTAQVLISGNAEVINRIALAIPSTNTDSKVLMKDPKQLSSEIYDIGLLAIVESLEEQDEFLLVHLQIEARIHINIELLLSDWEEQPQVWSRTQFFVEEFIPVELAIYSDIDNMLSVIEKNHHLFSPALASKAKAQKSNIRKMDLLAHSLLIKKEDRLNYIQSASNTERWLLLTTVISNILNNHTPKKTIKDYSSLSFRDRVKLLPIPSSLRTKILTEVDKQESLPSSSTEASMIKDYLTWIFQIPWGKSSRRELNLVELRKELDRSHYGLPDVKDYLLEHICIEQIKKAPSGAVLCLIGPPGTGKSSIARSLAAASGRQFQNIALGGLSDEAEIRGHRRTYIASRPGRIINALKSAGTMDPVILLDEIDKIDNSKGSPSSALLELLDPEQNHSFVDRYLELEVDMSHVLFICTANYESNIPPALLDRMELIHFREYTPEERSIILNNHILPKAHNDYNINELPISWDPKTLEQLVKHNQVRQIEKKVRRLLRMAALQIIINKQPNQIIDINFAKSILTDININNNRPVGF